MGKTVIRGMKARIGWEWCIRRRGPDGPDLAVEVYKLEQSEDNVTVVVGMGSLEEAERAAQGARAAKSFESIKESSKHLK